jgi:hypothetical protein
MHLVGCIIRRLSVKTLFYRGKLYPRKVTNPATLVGVKKLKHVQMLIQLKKLLHCTPPEVIVDIFKWYDDDNLSDGPGIDSRWCHWIFQ